jgi:hypothetical protein
MDIRPLVGVPNIGDGELELEHTAYLIPRKIKTRGRG